MQATYLLFVGLLPFLSSRNVHALMSCLQNSFAVMSQFDRRPGLKFLIQKVIQVDVAANLYKQAMLCLLFYVHTLLEISVSYCIADDELKHFIKTVAEKKNQSLKPDKEKTSSDKNNVEQLHEMPVMERAFDDNEWACAQTSKDAAGQFVGAFVRRLCALFDEVCNQYVECCLLSSSESLADRISSQTLVLLILDEEPVSQLPRDRTLQDIAVDKRTRDSTTADDVFTATTSGN